MNNMSCESRQTSYDTSSEVKYCIHSAEFEFCFVIALATPADHQSRASEAAIAWQSNKEKLQLESRLQCEFHIFHM